MTSIVPCHLSYVYVGLFSTIKPWMIVPVRKVIEVMAACQPVKHIQPTMYDRKRCALGGANSETQWY